MDRETCDFQLFAEKEVVEEVEDTLEQISLEDARNIDGKYDIGDIVQIPIESKSFGRIATQNAKNLLILGKHSICLSKVDAYIFAHITLYDTCNDIFFFFKILIIDYFTLFFADLL